ncbi:MAG: CheR family methyltransferase [Bacteroidales bacterium]
MTELGVVDIREIYKTINDTYGYDFSQFAMTSLKQRLERLMIRNNFSNTENLINKIKSDSEFFDLFLYEISVPSTEMFRDPSLWRWLREEFLEEAITKSIGKYRIWIPNCVSGGELYSLVIVLHEMGLLAKVEIIATTISNKSIEYIKEGKYDLKKLEVSAENYKRFHGYSDFSNYYKPDRYYAFRDTSYLGGVDFRKQNINFENSPQNVKLILFRNNLIYFNPALQEKVLQHMNECMSANGCLITGIREQIRNTAAGKDFEVVNEAECVYKKRIAV